MKICLPLVNQQTLQLCEKLHFVQLPLSLCFHITKYIQTSMASLSLMEDGKTLWPIDESVFYLFFINQWTDLHRFPHSQCGDSSAVRINWSALKPIGCRSSSNENVQFHSNNQILSSSSGHWWIKIHLIFTELAELQFIYGQLSLGSWQCGTFGHTRHGYSSLFILNEKCGERSHWSVFSNHAAPNHMVATI